MLQSIDISKPPHHPKVFLSKPNKQIISILKDIYNIKHDIKLGNLSELSFDIPVMVERDHNQIVNPNLSKIKDRYLLKLVVGDYVEWFLINQITKSMNDSGDAKSVHAFSLGYELSNKRIRRYEAASYNAQQVLTDALTDTLWSVGFIEEEYLTAYRQFSITSTKTILQFIQDIATTFNATLIYDTVNRTISLCNTDNIGANKGLKFSYGKLLKDAQETSDSDAMCTRLYCYGKDSEGNVIGIESVNVTGKGYIEDLSYYKNLDYMTQELIDAEDTYNALLATKQGVYPSLLTQLEVAQEALTTKKTELDNLNTQLKIIQDNLAIAQQDGDDTTDLLAQQTSQQNLIALKTNEVNTANENIASVQSEITDLQDEISLENNFTPELLAERNQFIIEQEWSNDYCFNASDLYQAGLVEFQKMKEPQLALTINVVDFLQLIEEQRNWDRLNLGDTVTVFVDRVGINVKAKITEISRDFESGNINLTIANVKEVSKNDDLKLIRQINNLIPVSNEVSTNSSNWNTIPLVQQAVTDLQTQPINASVTPIIAGVNNSVIVDDKGITIRNPNNPDEVIRLNFHSIIISEDGCQTAKVALSPSGVNSGVLRGQLIIGENLLIQTPDGLIQITPNGIMVYEADGVTLRAKLGDISTNQDRSLIGLKLINPNGETVLADGIIQNDTIQLAENCDATHPIKLKIYVPDDVLEVRSVKLSFSLEKFRTYETATASGGASTQTSSSGGGGTITSGASSTSTSASGGGSTQTSSDDVRFSMNLATTVPQSQPVSFESHNHGVTVPQITHHHDISIPDHTHSIAHTHSVSYSSHSHSVDLPSHAHPLSFGIFESTYASNVDVYVDGVLRLNNSGSHYNTDQNNLDIAQWITSSGWHTVELSSQSLGRINASLTMKSYVAL